MSTFLICLFFSCLSIPAGSLTVSITDMRAPVVGGSGGVYALCSAHLANVVMVTAIIISSIVRSKSGFQNRNAHLLTFRTHCCLFSLEDGNRRFSDQSNHMDVNYFFSLPRASLRDRTDRTCSFVYQAYILSLLSTRGLIPCD
ncbi:hypothetical protein GOODEAATRI_018142, partial [Goodea atripinnis]